MTTRDAKGTAKKLARKVLDVPEEQIPVVSSVDWVRGIFDFNFVTSVRQFTPPPSSPFNLSSHSSYR